MENLHNWCISRQIWFGHQIPVWYCKDCKKTIVQTAAPAKCTQCKSSKIVQDPDTLDTWFSSGLWTFSTLGWPKKNKDLEIFHPTSVLETGYDILFFWVARMILMTTYAINKIPFEHVYLHGLVLTRDGKKMSKSKPETCIDPLDMIAKYGTDALRLSMIIGSRAGNDIRLYEEKIAGYRNFINKIWNTVRFVLMNVTEEDKKIQFSKKHIKTTADKWILTRLQKLTKEAGGHLDKFELSEAGTKIYDFLWSEVCDWYLEMSKGIDKNPAVLLQVVRETLKLLHPFVPFVTEALWSHLGEQDMLIGAKWPTLNKNLIFADASRQIEILHKAIGEIRKKRAELQIPPRKKIHAIVYTKKYEKLFNEKVESIKKLASLEHIDISKKGDQIKNSMKIFLPGLEIFLPLKDMINIEEEQKRAEKELTEKEAARNHAKKLLDNSHFVEKAPAALVNEEKTKFDELTQAIQKLKEHQKELEKLQKI